MDTPKIKKLHSIKFNAVNIIKLYLSIKNFFKFDHSLYFTCPC